MRKQSFDGVRKALCILLTVLFLVSLTAASASAWYNKKGEVVSAPETTTAGNVSTPKITATSSAPTPVIATASSALGAGCNSCNNCGWGCNNCGFGGCRGCGCDDKKIIVITAVRASFAKGESRFDRVLW
jgi:hypothetical protein